MAEEKEYLTKDGVLNKAYDVISFNDAHTPFRQPRLIDREMLKKSGYKQNRGGTDVELGTKNQVMGVTLKDDPDKARGKRGEVIMFEEAGKCKGLLKAWEVSRPSVEQGAITTGIMVAYGTGGTEEADYEGLEELFYHPEAHNVLPVLNQWDEGQSDQVCSFFMPSYVNWEGFMDVDGNSDVPGARAYLEAEREKKKKSKDNAALEQNISENPFTPREATLQVSRNVFPTAQLAEQLGSVKAGKRWDSMAAGHLVRKSGVLTFKPSPQASPVFSYPIRKGDNTEGAIVIKESPFKNGKGAVPKGLYIIGHDPYAKDESQSSSSIGATYVFKRSNNFSRTLGGSIVASYVGRPATQDEYNDNLFALAEYYNAKIGFENNRGNIIQYAKRYKKLHYLAEDFDVFDKKDRRYDSRKKNYGITMNKYLKNQGELYIRDWLNEPLSTSEEGDTRKILHTLLDPALLQELIKFDHKGNFDRAMAVMIGMFYMEELYNKKVVVNPEGRSVHDDFFQRDIFV